MVYVCLISLNLSQDDVLYLSLELQILILETGPDLAALFGLPVSAFPVSLEILAKLPLGSFEPSEVHNFGQVLTKMEYDSPKLDLE